MLLKRAHYGSLNGAFGEIGCENDDRFSGCKVPASSIGQKNDIRAAAKFVVIGVVSSGIFGVDEYQVEVFLVVVDCFGCFGSRPGYR